VLNDGIVKFFSFLGSDACNLGTAKACATEVYLACFNTPGFLDVLLNSLDSKTIVDVSAIAWFLAVVARALPSARENPTVHRMAEVLSAADCEATKSLATILFPSTVATDVAKKVGVDAESITSLEQLKAFQPQHDNTSRLIFARSLSCPLQMKSMQRVVCLVLKPLGLSKKAV
jgi:hypothetical protein